MADDVHELCRPLADRYEIERELGRGGMGVVLLARQKQLGRQVAVKILTPEKLLSSDLGRFTREARAYAALSHPNLVKVYDADLESPLPHIVLEYVQGRDLHKLIWEGERFDTAGMGRELAGALAYIHGKGILHRDIKPSNILVRPDRHPVLMDFGLAKMVSGEEAALTKTGVAVGTPAYMAPETLQGEYPDPAADVYALGLVLYEMLARRLVFGIRGPEAVSPADRLNGWIPRFGKLGVTAPAQLEETIFACLSLNPASRLSAADLVHRLTARPGTGRSGRLSGRISATAATSTSTRRRWRPIAVIGLVVAALVLAGLANRSGRPPASASMAATARPATGSGPAASRSARPSWRDGAPMVLVPAGELAMGSRDGRPDEAPVRMVWVPAFYMDRYEVSNSLYSRFCRETGHPPRRRFPTCPELDRPDHPVVGVTWDDAVAYCLWTGKWLPTEAEWERAARGSGDRVYPWGDPDPWNPVKANLRDRSLSMKVKSELGGDVLDLVGASSKDDGYPYTAPVDGFPQGASPFGILQMAGNVREWCLDVYAADAYRRAADDGHRAGGSRARRVVRGGSWADSKADLRATRRFEHDPGAVSDRVGFRCAATPVPDPGSPVTVPGR